jgi:hypothetical protein
MRDPFIAEIRRIRRKIDKQIEKNPKAFHERLKEIEARHTGRLVDMQLRPVRRGSADGRG